MKAIGCVFALGLLLWFPCWLWQGYLGSYVWQWFAVDLFGAHPLTTWQAAGVIVLLHFFLPTQIREPKKKDDDVDEFTVVSRFLGGVITYGFLFPAVTFASAFVVRRFM